jgi:UDP-glucose 4-epimerase
MKAENNRCISLAVLGSRGFIGKRIVETLSKDPSFKVEGFSSLHANLTDSLQTLSLKNNIREGEALVIAAAITRDRKDTPTTMLDNIKIASNIVSLIFGHPVSHVVYLSTVDVYGRENLRLPLDETSDIRPSSYYAISKYASELILQKACRDGNISFTILRLPGVYGPDDTHESPIKVFITSAIKKSLIKVTGDGSQLRDFLFVDDIHKVIRQVIFKKISGIYNIVTGKSHTINQILNLIEDISKYKLNKAYDKKSKDKQDMVFNKSALLSQLPGFRFTDLSEGLARTYNYYKKHYSNILNEDE